MPGDGPKSHDQEAGHAHREAPGPSPSSAETYEKLWDFRGALTAARAAGDLPLALGYAIDARDPTAISAILAELSASQAGMRKALDILTRKRRHAEAAPVAENLGEVELAIDLFRRSGNPLEAARLLEGQGRDRDAGQLLERALDLAAPNETAQLQLALGRILARRGAYPEATQLLQEARKSPQLRAEAQRHLIAALAAMGLRDAARDMLLDLRAHANPGEQLVDLDSYLRSWRDRLPTGTSQRDRELIGGRYRLERSLGAGASGRVVLAFDEIAGRTVAIKMFAAASARGGTAYERFVREARVASALRHPSLVEVYEVSFDQGFLVMEYLPGGSLAQRLAAGEPMTGSQVRRMALDLIGGLEVAHHRGVVHRDVKPANIFFDARGSAKLGDFGVAHLVDLGQTQTGGLIGTLAYMSPEQITGAPISVAADLYSLGITVFEALTRRLPFLGPDFVAQHLGEMPPMVSRVADGVSPEWDHILGKLLIKDPTQRMQTLAELRQQLEALDLSGPIHSDWDVRRETAPEPSAAAPAVSEPKQRYQFETPFGSTQLSKLSRAVDSVLDRSVIIERFDASPLAATAMDRTRLLARAQTPFVQRALSLDRATRTAVFEAPAGAAIADSIPGVPPVEQVRLLKRLARAIAAIHELGASHGAIGVNTVVVDDSLVPTLITAGLGVVPTRQPTDDVAAVIAVVAAIVGCEPTFGAIATAICSQVGVSCPRYSPSVDGESLYAAADALDTAVQSAIGT